MSIALDILRERFGYSQFRFQQQKIVESLIAGKDALVLMPTGGGKSLCYQIPALAREGVGIVISPLIALMQDQVDALEINGVKAAFINSTQDPSAQAEVRRRLLGGEIDLLYVAPERAATPDFLQLIDAAKLALFAIDEAHCVSQWGHDFRPDYRNLYRLHERFPQVPRIALTATADRNTRLEIEQQLQLEQAEKFIHSFDRPNIFYRISDGGGSKQQLWNFISNQHPEDSGIVYCLSRKQVEATADWLQQKGRHALPYHAGLDAATRSSHQRIFLQQEGVIIVATIAFGMGIDKPDVRFVAHLNLPKNIESYYQETGRAGRDGQPANAWLAYGLQDVIMLRQMAMEGAGDETHKLNLQRKLDAMLGFAEQTACRRQTLLGYFGESLDQPCGHCDNCRNPPPTWDATESAQMALSCIYRTGQRFGVNYLIDVLLGKAHERIQRNGHDRVSTFGIGEKLGQSEWRALFRQLIALGLVRSDPERHGALRLEQSCNPLLRGETRLYLRQMTKQKEPSAASKEKTKTVRHADQPLFEALREWRGEIAQSNGLPPYVILHDKTLKDLCVKRPKNLSELDQVSGIGAQKQQRYGSDLLAIIQRFPIDPLLDNSLGNSANQTLELWQRGITPREIATRREISQQTVYNHLASAIAEGVLELQQVVDLDDQQLGEINHAFEFAEDDTPRLKTVFDMLDGRYDYDVLNCVRASLAHAASG